MKIRSLGIIFSILLIASFSRAQETQTLEQVLNLAQQQSLNSRLADDQQVIAESQWQIFKKSNLPRVRLNGNLPNFSSAFQAVIQPDGNILFNPVRNNSSYLGLQVTQNVPLTGGIIQADIELQRFDDLAIKEHQYFAQPFNLAYYQPFFQSNENKWNKKTAPAEKELANRQYQAVQNQVEQEAADRFFELLIQQNLLKIAEEQLVVTQQLHDIAQKRFDLGHLSKSDLLQLEVQDLSAQQNIGQLQQNFVRAERQLAVFLNKPAATPLALMSPPSPQKIEVSLEQLQSQAIQQDAILAQLKVDLIGNRKDQADLRSESGWQAGLYASAGWSKSDQSLPEALNQPKLQQRLELNFSLPLVDWGTQKQNKKQLSTLQSSIEKQIAFRQKEVRNEVSLAMEQYLQVMKALEVALQIEALATERYEIVKKQFVLEKINLTELTIATTEKESKQTAYLNLLRSAWKTYLQLNAYSI